MDDGEEIARYVNRSAGRSVTDLWTRMEDEGKEKSLEESVQTSKRDVRGYGLLGKYFSSVCSRIADFFGYPDGLLSEEERFYRFVDNELDMSEFKDYTD